MIVLEWIVQCVMFLWWLVRLCPYVTIQSDMRCWHCNGLWVEQEVVPEYRAFYKVGFGTCPKCKEIHPNGITLAPGESMTIGISLGSK